MKQRFMVDTNVVRILLERSSPHLDQWFAEERCSLRTIVAAEIRFGLAQHTLSERRDALVGDLLALLSVEPFYAEVSATYGLLSAELQRLGISLAAMDLLIAAHAMALERPLVGLEQAFANVPGLECVAIDDGCQANTSSI